MQIVNTVSHCLYNLFIYGYGGLIRLFSLFNAKAKFWINGRKNVFSTLAQFKQQCNKPIVWIHCASLGEFEQGRPLIERMRNEDAQRAFILTFFSPSGYEIRKNYSGADLVCYLPLDTPRNADRFVSIMAPQMAVFVKYEYWFNYMESLYKQSIPLYVVSAIFRPDQYFFKSYGKWFAEQLARVSHFFVQNQASCILLNSLGYKNYTLCGDTRFDRVFEISQNKKSFPIIEAFCEANKDFKIWVIGSSWHPDELLFVSLIAKEKGIRLIIAPHEIDEFHLHQVELLFASQRVIFYTSATVESVTNADILIIDTMGMLSQIYQYAHIAYVGGGFGAGIHNILEAAAYSIPVVFGPRYQKFDEAVSLIASGGAFSINNSRELLDIAQKLMNNNDEYQKVSAACSVFVKQNIGATDKILTHILFR